MVVGGGGVKIFMAIIKMTPPPNCRIQDVTSLALFVHLSGFIHIIAISMPLIHKNFVVGEGGGGGGGGQNIMAIIKKTPPAQLQNTRCYLASPVCTFEWFIHIILFPCL